MYRDQTYRKQEDGDWELGFYLPFQYGSTCAGHFQNQHNFSEFCIVGGMEDCENYNDIR